MVAVQIIQYRTTTNLVFHYYYYYYTSPLRVCQVVTDTDTDTCIDMVELFAYDNVCRLWTLIKYEIAGCI